MIKDQSYKKNKTSFQLGHKPLTTGRTYFKKGQTPWNKGLKRPEMSGKNHPNWQGGVTTENHKQRIEFRRNLLHIILERDGYKCQICNSTGELQIDHIQSWAEFKELRFDPDNCRTLCAKCHYQVTFGKKMPKEVKTWGRNLMKERIVQ